MQQEVRRLVAGGVEPKAAFRAALLWAAGQELLSDQMAPQWAPASPQAAAAAAAEQRAARLSLGWALGSQEPAEGALSKACAVML